MKEWVTSDTHYGHKNICRGTTDWRTPEGLIPIEDTRDFTTLEEMNSVIVNSINAYVKEGDILYHLGDWSFGGIQNIKIFYESLKCKNVHIICGNHDHHIIKNKDGVAEIFKSVQQYKEVKIGKSTFVMFHYPISSWNGLNKGNIHLHGHCHLPGEKRMGKGKRMDIGLFGHPEVRPYNISDELIPLMEKIEINSELWDDHHIGRLQNVVG